MSVNSITEIKSTGEIEIERSAGKLPKTFAALSEDLEMTNYVLGLSPAAKEKLDKAGKLIDDTTTATDKVWSSEKTSSEVGSVNDKVVQQYELGYLGGNLLNHVVKNSTINGITATVNKDNSITLNGTASAITYFDLVQGGTFDSTKYVGCLLSGIESFISGLSIRISSGSRASIQEYYGWTDLSIENNGSGLYLAIRISSGLTLSNVTIKPMIRQANTDKTYIPYSESNVVLTDKVNAVYDNGFATRNIFVPYEYGRTVNGVTWTTVGNGVYHAQGTSSGGSPLVNNTSVVLPSTKLKKGVTYTISGGTSNTVIEVFVHHTTEKLVGTTLTEYSVQYTPSNDVEVDTRPSVWNGKTVNEDIYIQIESGSEATTYQPYAKSNVELTEEVATKSKWIHATSIAELVTELGKLQPFESATLVTEGDLTSAITNGNNSYTCMGFIGYVSSGMYDFILENNRNFLIIGRISNGAIVNSKYIDSFKTFV